VCSSDLFLITIGAEGTISCPFEAKKSKNVFRICEASMLGQRVDVKNAN
jgi:hypothetical protein